MARVASILAILPVRARRGSEPEHVIEEQELRFPVQDVRFD